MNIKKLKKNELKSSNPPPAFKNDPYDANDPMRNLYDAFYGTEYSDGDVIGFERDPFIPTATTITHKETTMEAEYEPTEFKEKIDRFFSGKAQKPFKSEESKLIKMGAMEYEERLRLNTENSDLKKKNKKLKETLAEREKLLKDVSDALPNIQKDIQKMEEQEVKMRKEIDRVLAENKRLKSEKSITTKTKKAGKAVANWLKT